MSHSFAKKITFYIICGNYYLRFILRCFQENIFHRELSKFITIFSLRVVEVCNIAESEKEKNRKSPQGYNPCDALEVTRVK